MGSKLRRPRAERSIRPVIATTKSTALLGSGMLADGWNTLEPDPAAIAAIAFRQMI